MSAPAADTSGDLSIQSTDAVPIETMPHGGHGYISAFIEQTNTQAVNIPAPHDDWEFNKFLLDVATDIDANGGLNTMKHMLRGHGGIGLAVLEEMKTTLELFDILRKRTYISRYNVVHLQALIRILKRPELDRRAIEFSREMGNVVYFFHASGEPPSQMAFGGSRNMFESLSEDRQVQRGKRTRHSTGGGSMHDLQGRQRTPPKYSQPAVFINSNMDELKELPPDEKLNVLMEGIANIGLLKCRIERIESDI